jgi:hypothetical protein
MCAGRALIDASEREPPARHDLIYPVLFCYRHGLEMAIKWIVSRYGPSVGGTKLTLDHNLWQLWQCELLSNVVDRPVMSRRLPGLVVT